MSLPRTGQVRNKGKLNVSIVENNTRYRHYIRFCFRFSGSRGFTSPELMHDLQRLSWQLSSDKK